MARGSPIISPDAASISTMARCACFTVRPAMACQASPSGTPGGGVSVMRPVAGEDVRVGRSSSRHHTTSVEVAEGADHRDARPLVRLGEVVGEDGHLHPEERRVHGRPEARRVALVVGVGDQRHAGGDELGPRGLDLDVVEAQPVVGAGLLAVLHLGLRHRGLVVDVPQRRRLGGVGLAPGQVAQEHALARPPAPVVDGGVAQSQSTERPDPAPQCLEGALVVGGELVAQRDEVGPADRDVLRARLLRAARSRGRRAGTGRRSRRSRSAPGARSAGRCRPIPSGRRPSTPACAGSGRRRRSARSRRPIPCAVTPTPSAGGCRWRRPDPGWHSSSKR